MSLKIQIKRAMFSEGIEDRMQDIATLIDMPVEDVDKRLKTLSFSDYIEVMTSLRQKNEDTIKRIMGLDVNEDSYSHKYADIHGTNIKDYPEDFDIHDIDYDELNVCDRCGDIQRWEDEMYWKGEEDSETNEILGDEHEAVCDRCYGELARERGVDEAYSTGSQGSGGTIAPDEEEEEIAGTVDMPMTSQDNQKVKSARTQAMQRLGRDNLGGATAQQTADAMDKAGQGKALTPIQRRSMAAQTQNLDNLATNPQTRMQFKNLLNKLRMQQNDQEG